VIEQHRGSICVESQRQLGTTFSIFLPVSGGIE
jgi:signal transduction histidine kinase